MVARIFSVKARKFANLLQQTFISEFAAPRARFVVIPRQVTLQLPLLRAPLNPVRTGVIALCPSADNLLIESTYIY